jgi:hypothetical protein
MGRDRVAIREERLRDRKFATTVIGAAAELRVAAFLMMRGWEVFMPMSQACSCDMLAMYGKNKLRIEVKSSERCGNKLHPDKLDSATGLADIIVWTSTTKPNQFRFWLLPSREECDISDVEEYLT